MGSVGESGRPENRAEVSRRRRPTVARTMKGPNHTRLVGQLPTETTESTTVVPAVFTRLVWVLWLLSTGLLAARLTTGGPWDVAGVFVVDGLTLLMWVVVTFFSGIVHSYSRRYMAGSRDLTRFFTRVFAFTLAVMVLVAADHVVMFAAAWLAMGLVMADLIGYARDWPQAQAAATVARRYFLASTGLLVVAVAVLWNTTGAVTVSGLATAVDGGASTTVLVAAVALVLAAMVQSALLPFHTWLLSSMTAPTPASALMHAGFVNAGGILLVRFGPVVTVDPTLLLLVVVVGAASALGGKLAKSVQSDVKRQLGCSTVGQMGFMIMQVGLGFFGAAITHLILHGFYKAYLFLSSGEQVSRTAPTASRSGSETPGLVGTAVVLSTALVGGALFAVLTGKGTSLDSGVLLALLVVLMTLQAARTVVGRTALPATVRYGAVPLVFLPAIAVYAAVYTAVTRLLADLAVVTAPLPLSVPVGVVVAAFVVTYVVAETGRYQHSQRLYVALLNATQPPKRTLLTKTEEYNEY